MNMSELCCAPKKAPTRGRCHFQYFHLPVHASNLVSSVDNNMIILRSREQGRVDMHV